MSKLEEYWQMLVRDHRLQIALGIIIILMFNAYQEMQKTSKMIYCDIFVGLVGLIWLLYRIEAYFAKIWQALEAANMCDLMAMFMLLFYTIKVGPEIRALYLHLGAERFFLLIGKICFMGQIVTFILSGQPYLAFPAPGYPFYSTAASKFSSKVASCFKHTPAPILEILTVKFTTEDATQEKYQSFIEALRKELAPGVLSFVYDKQLASEHHKIKVMRDRSTFSKTGASERLLYMELSTSLVCSVTLVLDKCDAYVVGYKAQKVCYLLKLDAEKSWVEDVIEGSVVSLPLGFSYADLETKAGESSRLDIGIGIKELESAIKVLHDTNPENIDIKSVAKALIVCITMITEAARFYYIEKKVCDNIVEGGRKTFYKTFNIDEFMVKLQNSWAQNSSVAQKMLPHMALMKYEKEDGDLGVGTSSSHQREMSQNSENTNGNENGDGKEKVNRTSAKGKEKVTEFVEEDGDHQQVRNKNAKQNGNGNGKRKGKGKGKKGK